LERRRKGSTKEERGVGEGIGWFKRQEKSAKSFWTMEENSTKEPSRSAEKCRMEKGD